MTKPLVIVESPTKARTIEKFLGGRFNVLASYGHIRDLPNSAAEIPEKMKDQKWTRLGINIEDDFAPLYVIPSEKKKRVSELRSAIKEASELLLATDEDREGESISWHLLEVLNPKIPVKRLVFHEITKSAIDEALDSARDIDSHLVRAQETRRIIDRLFGYEVSPLLWKKMRPKLSAGRVQSVALRLLVERERERIRFKKAVYWDLKGVFSKRPVEEYSNHFEAELIKLDDRRVAIGKDFDPTTGKLAPNSSAVLVDEEKARGLVERLKDAVPRVASVERKPFTSRPYPPFTTSTLQQEASRKLSFAARRTMSVAQTLYENGFITYMRTDSTTLSKEALEGARGLVEERFGAGYLHPEPRIYKTKVRNAQEAHEAIRPAGLEFAEPDDVRSKLGVEAFRLYELIWKRTLACQMKDSKGTRVAVQVDVDGAVFRASGKTIEFPGFLRAYVEGSDDPEAELADREKLLPPIEEGEELDTVNLEPLEHTTQPPARFTEGSLIKELERLGIGRPSTWATIVDVVLSRTYAFKRGNTLVPTFLATAVIGMMEQNFAQLLQYEFTARMEDDLDAIARGEANEGQYLKEFYFGNSHPGLRSLVDRGNEEIDPRIVCGIPLGSDPEGRTVEVRIGRYGPFVSNGEDRASLAENVAPDELTVERAVELLVEAAKGPQSLGDHPETNLPVYLKTGRYGPYVQMGDQGDNGEKPKMVSLLPGMSPEEVTFDLAVKLLEFPRNLGKHPEEDNEVLVANGPYGPYVKAGTETRSIPTDDYSPLEMTLEDALAVLKLPKRRGRATQPKSLKEIGKHPGTDAMIVLKSGRYGPYVTDGKVNASIPKGSNPEELTLEDAVNLIEARAARVGSSTKKTAKKKTATKKSTSKKSTAKKSTKAAAKRKAASKKSTAKKTTAKKSVAKKSTSKKSSTSKKATKRSTKKASSK